MTKRRQCQSTCRFALSPRSAMRQNPYRQEAQSRSLHQKMVNETSPLCRRRSTKGLSLQGGFAQPLKSVADRARGEPKAAFRGWAAKPTSLLRMRARLQRCNPYGALADSEMIPRRLHVATDPWAAPRALPKPSGSCPAPRSKVPPRSAIGLRLGLPGHPPLVPVALGRGAGAFKCGCPQGVPWAPP